MVDLQRKIHEKRDSWVVRFDQPDGFLREEQVVVFARVVYPIAGLVSAPQVSNPLSCHLKQRPGPGTMWAICAARFCSTIVDGRRVRCRDGAPAMLSLRCVVRPVAVAVVWSGAHAVNAVARGEVVHGTLLVVKACVEASARGQHIIGRVAKVPLGMQLCVMEEQERTQTG